MELYTLLAPKDESEVRISAKVAKSDVIQSVNAIGKVYPKNSVDLGAQVSGQIKALCKNWR